MEAPEHAVPPAAPKRSLRPIMVLGLLTVAAISGGVWFALNTSSDQVPPQEPTATDGLDIAPQDVSSPLVVPIDDAADVIAEIDANSAEAEALDLLGLEETGNPVSASDPVVGYSFTWHFGADETVTTTVDATTGSYSAVAGDGAEFRRVGDRTFSRQAGSSWLEVAPDGALAPAAPFGVNVPLTIDRVLDPKPPYFTATVTDDRSDGTSHQTIEVDAHRYATEQPTAFQSWITQLGHPRSDAVLDPGEVIIIEAELATDRRTVVQMTAASTSFTTSYLLAEVFDVAPEIEVPDV